MIRYIALLRAINVGGHKVKMDRLRKLFESLGLSNVETFIASGNVIFDSPAEDARTLEKQIEDYLRKSLGFEVATFVRSVSELEAIAGYRPFMPPRIQCRRQLALHRFPVRPTERRGATEAHGLPKRG